MTIITFSICILIWSILGIFMLASVFNDYAESTGEEIVQKVGVKFTMLVIFLAGPLIWILTFLVAIGAITPKANKSEK